LAGATLPTQQVRGPGQPSAGNGWRRSAGPRIKSV